MRAYAPIHGNPYPVQGWVGIIKGYNVKFGSEGGAFMVSCSQTTF